ncbi:exonuclease SbcCD subunit D, partial [Rhizobium johnstonii]
GVDATPLLERDIQQGGVDVVPIAVFDAVDYAALGHIHGRQTLTDSVRYSGAPLHYSFGEGDKPRGSWLVELDADGLSRVDWVPLPVPRRLMTLTASLEQLLTSRSFDDAQDAWVCAQYTDALPERDPLRRLQERFPHCAMVSHVPQGGRADDGRSYVQRVRAAR